MKKFFLIISIFVASFFCYTITSAQLNQKQQTGGQKTIIKFASYVDYFPISKIDNIKSIPSYEGVFDNFIKDMCDSYHYECQPFINNNYIQTIKANTDELDIVIGAYSDSNLYEDYKLIYPSILDNPVHLVMLPSNISKISKISDLKPLKGAIDSNEQWNDFVLEQFSDLDIKTMDSSEEMYRQLISGEIDYVFTTYWYGTSEIMKLGIQDFVSVSQKGIWNMPLFIAVSNSSRHQAHLEHYITEELKKEGTIEKIKNRAIEKLNEVKLNNQGVVPEAYILKKDDN